MAQIVAEVLEAEATGKVKDIFDDIKSTFRIPSVSAVFRVLAQHPDYLQIAWRVLKPNAQTVYFEDAAGSLRSQAIEGIREMGLSASPAAGNDAQSLVDVLHYGAAKQFLATVALRSATTGLQPKLAELPLSVKRQIAPGVPQVMQSLEAIEAKEPAAAALHSLSQTFGQAGLSAVDQEFRALASWPEFLNSTLESWRRISAHQTWPGIRRSIVRAADDVVGTLPFRMDIYPHALRHAGLAEREIDSVRSVLTSFQRGLPLLLLTSAHLSVSLRGLEKSLESPFPASFL